LLSFLWFISWVPGRRNVKNFILKKDILCTIVVKFLQILTHADTRQCIPIFEA